VGGIPGDNKNSRCPPLSEGKVHFEEVMDHNYWDVKVPTAAAATKDNVFYLH